MKRDIRNLAFAVLLVLLTSLGAYAQEFESDANTVALYHLNEGSGQTVQDISGNGNDGSLGGGVRWIQQARYGAGLSFDGMNGYVRIPDSESFGTISANRQLTIEMWLYVRAYPPYPAAHLVKKWSGTGHNAQSEYYTDIRYDGKVSFFLNNGSPDVGVVSSIVSEVPVPLNSWHLVSFVWDGVSRRAMIFMDGEEIGSTENVVNSMPNSTTQVEISSPPPYTLDGIIDELRISNVARYQQRVFDLDLQQLYLSTEEYFNYTKNTGNADSLSIIVWLENKEDFDLRNIGFRCSVEGSNIPINIPIEFDNNPRDNKIDRIAARDKEPVPIAAIAALPAIWENKSIEIATTEANGVPFQLRKTFVLSSYYLADARGRPYSVKVDGYSFKNTSASFKELFRAVRDISSDFIARTGYFLMYQLQGAWNGLCLGYASTSATYYAHPEYRPVALATSEMDSVDWKVRENIIHYHFWGNIPMSDLQFPDPATVFETSTTILKNGRPVILGMLSEDSTGHAVLVYRAIRDDTDQKGYLYLYDPNHPGQPTTAQVDLATNWFSYQPPFETTVYIRAKVWYPQVLDRAQLKRDVWDFIGAEISDIYQNCKQIVGVASPVRILLTDQYGRRVGFVGGIEWVNEIPRTRVFRFQSGARDSAFFFYTPASLNYTVSIFGVEADTMHFEVVRPLSASSAQRYSYGSIVVSRNWIGSVYIGFSSDYVLHVDSDGDGREDQSVPPERNLITSVAGKDKSRMPSEYCLFQNYPNPFNSGTMIRYALPRKQYVQLKVLDPLGSEVRLLSKGNQGPGYHEVLWDGRDNQGLSVASGVYICTFQAGNLVQSRKIVLLR